MNLLSDEEAKQLYDTGKWESGKAAAQIAFWFLDAGKSTRVDASKVTAAMLVVAAGKDHSAPASAARKIARKYPTARYLEYPDHAHWIIGEKGWEEVCEMIECWLKSNAKDKQ
jgi:alpha-beta hydrolase superfamily lysophospholipase